MICMDKPHFFTRTDITRRLNACIGKTLGELDTKHVLDSPTNKGVAGHVIEKSVLGYPADSARRPDLNIDGLDVELKTTGIRASKKEGISFEAKEPMSITALKPDEIIDEEFESSAFWHKVQNMLFVCYVYEGKPKKGRDYSNFPVHTAFFKTFEGEDKEQLQRDWTTIREFVRDLYEENPDSPAFEKISSGISKEVSPYLDTAPKWPHPPRIRFRRAFVNSIINEHLKKTVYEHIPDEERLSSFDELDHKLQELTNKFAGKTIAQIAAYFDMEIPDKVPKQLAEQIVVRMFGGTSRKMHNIALFQKMGIVGKTVALNPQGMPTEDTKLMSIDFNELESNDVYEESDFYYFFKDNDLLYMVFQEPEVGISRGGEVFLGFARVPLEPLAEKNGLVESVWDIMRDLIISRKLRLVPETDKSGAPILNKNGVPREAPNWPKSTESALFVRGTGRDSTDKPEVVNGLPMYRQSLWFHKPLVKEQIEQHLLQAN